MMLFAGIVPDDVPLIEAVETLPKLLILPPVDEEPEWKR